MLIGFVRGLTRIRVTVAYALILVGVTTALAVLGPRISDRVISHASTNLHNLSHGHLGTLFVSAFVIDAGPIYVWLPGLVCLLAIVELLWGSARLLLAFVVGHVGATLLVAIGLTAAVELTWLSADVTRATDVGMSYGAAAVLGALSAAVPRQWRPLWAGWWLGVAVAVVAVGRDFTDAGHAVALTLGMLVSTRFGSSRGWTPVRCALLFVALAFGYLMLASTWPAPLVSAGLGVLGALAADLIVGRRRRRASEPSRDAALTRGSPMIAGWLISR
jgi:rhomboid family protein